MKPANVTRANSNIVRHRLFPINKRKKRKAPPLFTVGDYVRISRKKRTFQKEHAPTWTEEVSSSSYCYLQLVKYIVTKN